MTGARFSRALAAARALRRRAARLFARNTALARLRARLNARLATLTLLRAPFNRALARLSRSFAASARSRAAARDFAVKRVTPVVAV